MCNSGQIWWGDICSQSLLQIKGLTESQLNLVKNIQNNLYLIFLWYTYHNILLYVFLVLHFPIKQIKQNNMDNHEKKEMFSYA